MQENHNVTRLFGAISHQIGDDLVKRGECYPSPIPLPTEDLFIRLRGKTFTAQEFFAIQELIQEGVIKEYIRDGDMLVNRIEIEAHRSVWEKRAAKIVVVTYS